MPNHSVENILCQWFCNYINFLPHVPAALTVHVRIHVLSVLMSLSDLYGQFSQSLTRSSASLPRQSRAFQQPQQLPLLTTGPNPLDSHSDWTIQILARSQTMNRVCVWKKDSRRMSLEMKMTGRGLDLTKLLFSWTAFFLFFSFFLMIPVGLHLPDQTERNELLKYFPLIPI